MTVPSLTPMQRQYQALKLRVSDAILFFRLGDFYEMFGDDAAEASKILEITLTSRNKNAENPEPMCGIPHHAAENYLAKLIKAGKKVAIAEQVSDPTAPGLTERDIVKIITPGTTFSENILETKKSNYLAGFFGDSSFSLALCEVSTGDIFVIKRDTFEEIFAEIQKFRPAEVVFSPEQFTVFSKPFSALRIALSRQFLPKNPSQFTSEFFGVQTLKAFGIHEEQSSIAACALLLLFLQETQKSSLSYLFGIRKYDDSERLPMDIQTLKNLEIFQGSNGDENASLLSLLDETETAMGGRFLRNTMLAPLKKEDDILRRIAGVAELAENSSLLSSIQKCLKNTGDMERIIARLSTGRGTPRDLVALKKSLLAIQELSAILKNSTSPVLQELQKELEEEFL